MSTPTDSGSIGPVHLWDAQIQANLRWAVEQAAKEHALPQIPGLPQAAEELLTEKYMPSPLAMLWGLLQAPVGVYVEMPESVPRPRAIGALLDLFNPILLSKQDQTLDNLATEHPDLQSAIEHLKGLNHRLNTVYQQVVTVLTRVASLRQA